MCILVNNTNKRSTNAVAHFFDVKNGQVPIETLAETNQEEERQRTKYNNS